MEVKVTQKVVKEVEVTTDFYDECDKCKTRIKTGNFDSFECDFKYQEGNVYPEGCGDISQTTMELCQRCGQELVETLKSLGYRLNFRKLDI
jgi:hypothetical protein